MTRVRLSDRSDAVFTLKFPLGGVSLRLCGFPSAPASEVRSLQ